MTENEAGTRPTAQPVDEQYFYFAGRSCMTFYNMNYSVKYVIFIQKH